MIDSTALLNASEYARPMIQRMSRGRFCVDDILQSAVLQAWRKQETFRHESSVKTWVTTICIRLALMELRKHRYEMVTLNESMRSQRLDPEMILLKKERNSRLVDAILDLSPSLRSEALLRSQGVGPKSSAVRKGRAFRMRRELRQQLGA